METSRAFRKLSSRILKTSSEVELMQTRRRYSLPHSTVKLKTSSEVELMETCGA